MKVKLERCSFAGWLCLGLLLSVLTVSAQISKPVGTFSSAGAGGSGIYSNTNLRGALIRATWAEIQPTQDGAFDFTAIDTQVNNLKAKNSQLGLQLGWSLAVIGGGVGSPSWLTDPAPGLNLQSVTYSFRNVSSYKLPLLWDPEVQSRLSALATALANKYHSDPDLKLVYVTQMTANGIEGHLQGVDMQAMISKGYSDQVWQDNSIAVAKYFANAFAAASGNTYSNKAIAFEVHEVNSSYSVPMNIINALWNDSTLGQRVGAAVWWLSGRSDYQPNLVTSLMSYPGDIYGQVIGKSYEGAWQANTSYAKATVRMPINPPATNRLRYEVTAAGLSGPVEPIWPTTVGSNVEEVNAAGIKTGLVWISKASQFEGGDYNSVFTQAMAMGMRYIEPWDYEFVSGDYNTSMAAFNAWADEHFIAPAAPTGLTATRGNAQVTLDWANNTESDLAGYFVYRATTSGGPYTLVSSAQTPLTASNYTDTSVTNGTTYYYVVTAEDNWANESAYSSQVSATPLAPVTLTFYPVADSYVVQNSSSNFGSNQTMEVKNSGTDRRFSYLRFNVTGVSGTITSATVKLKCAVTQTGNTRLYPVSDTTWSETGVNWSNKPTMGAQADDKSNPGLNGWISLNATSLITANGTYSFGLQTTSTSAVAYYTKERGGTADDPVLEVVYQP